MKKYFYYSFLLILTCNCSIAQFTFQKTYGGTGFDIGLAVEQTFDKGFVVGGYTYSYGAGQQDYYLLKTDSTGDTLWTKTYGGAINDATRSFQQTDDGYIIAGATNSFGSGSYDVYLVKTDFNGNLMWS